MYDVTNEEQVFSVQCGGGHRSWDLLLQRDDVTGELEAMFVYVKQQTVVTCQETICRRQQILSVCILSHGKMLKMSHFLIKIFVYFLERLAWSGNL